MAAADKLAAPTQSEALAEKTSNEVALQSDSPPATTSHQLSVEGNSGVRILEIPSYMSYTDFCRFCGPSMHKSEKMVFDRCNGNKDFYSVLIKFDTPSSAHNFYQRLNGTQFPSLQEGGVCNVQIMLEETTIMSSPEETTCSECHETFGLGHGCVLTTLCGHSFHYVCLDKWSGTSCPVCGYCQQQVDELNCSTCRCREDIWICALCCYVGCGRYKSGHSIEHWEKTKHKYAVESGTQKVWNFEKQNFVHRLIQSEFLEKLTAHGDATKREDALSGVEGVVEEYSTFLVSLLEDQKKYLKEQIQNMKDENEREIDVAMKNAKSEKIKQLETKNAKLRKDIKVLEMSNENLEKELQELKQTVTNEETRLAPYIQEKDEQIQTLKEKLKNEKLKYEQMQ